MLTEFLSLDDVARILRVDYKTVYRLVRSGRLLAGRVGRVYRVRPEDLEVFFESSKAHTAGSDIRPLPAVDPMWCCATGKRIISELDIGGYCATTGQPICREAWNGGARRASAANEPGESEESL